MLCTRLSSGRLASRSRLAAATTVLALPALVLPATAGAVPISRTLQYACNFPLMVPQPLTLHIESDIPATIDAGTSTPAFPISATADVSPLAAKGLRALGSATVEGTAAASASVALPAGGTLPVKVNTTVEKTAIPGSGAFSTKATGQTPPLTFDDPGKAVFTIGGLVLDLEPRLADGTLTGLNEFETECTLVAGQDATFATIDIVDGTPAPTPSPSPSPSPTPGPTPTPTATPIPTPTPTPPITAVTSYAIRGSAGLRTLTRGTVPLSGSILARLRLATGEFDADLTLNPTQARLTALGFLPVTAAVSFATSGPTTGTVGPDGLRSTSRVRIKIPSIKAFGAIPLAGGNSCQTRQLSTVNLTSPGFDVLMGGALTGTFAISELNGCGLFNGLISPLTAGGGNTLSLQLSPQLTA